MTSKSNPRLIWLYFFVAINIVASLVIFQSGELLGDAHGAPLYSLGALMVALILVCFSYILILGPLFNFISRISVAKIDYGVSEKKLGISIGVVLLILQLIFLMFSVQSGLYMAGSGSNRSDSFMSKIFVLIPVYELFLIYYGFYRTSRLFYPNILVALVSAILRGWTGILLVIAFMEWCRLVRENKLKYRFIPLAAVALLIFYPFISAFKWIIRSQGATGYDLPGAIENLLGKMNPGEYFEAIQAGFMHLIGRLQSISLLVEVQRNSSILQTDFSSGGFIPFWREGLHGVVLDRITNSDSMYIGVFFTKFLTGSDQIILGDWNVSLGYSSWFFISPESIVLYIAYTIFLCLISHYFLSLIAQNRLSQDILWFVWFSYLLAPWFAIFIRFIYAAVVFLLLTACLALIMRWLKSKFPATTSRVLRAGARQSSISIG
jgi:hypothetical protein